MKHEVTIAQLVATEEKRREQRQTDDHFLDALRYSMAYIQQRPTRRPPWWVRLLKWVCARRPWHRK